MERHLKAVLLRPTPLTQSQVPFTKMPGVITCALQHFSHRDEFWIKITFAYRIDELLAGRSLCRISRRLSGKCFLMTAGRGHAMTR